MAVIAESYTGRALRAVPTLLKISFAEAIAYRAEFFVWMLTTTMPLIMMALMTAVAGEHPIGGWDARDLVDYYLANLLVRVLSGAWVVWEMTQDIRMGTMSMRLMRPIHPAVSYATDNIAAQPLRGMLAIPVLLVLLIFSKTGGVTHDPRLWAMTAVAIVGSWAMQFTVMSIMGCLAFFLDSATSFFELWMGLWMVFSGYLIPLDLFPAWMQHVGLYLPFRFIIDVPVRMLLGRDTPMQALTMLGEQWLWVFGLLVGMRYAWRAGLKRYGAFGG